MPTIRALFLFLLPAALARGDLVISPPPGQARLWHLLELGPYADRVCTEYRVRKGDTLGAIAEKHLGSVKRVPEILALNPGLDAKALPVGDDLVLPPRLDPKEKGLPWIDFMDRIGPRFVRHFPSGEHVRGTLFAVPHALLEPWRKDPMKPLEGVAAGTPEGGFVEVDPESKAEWVERRWRLKRIAEGRMEWELVGERLLDRERKEVVAPKEPSRNGGPADLFLGCLAAAGLLGLGFALSRRLRARAA